MSQRCDIRLPRPLIASYAVVSEPRESWRPAAGKEAGQGVASIRLRTILPPEPLIPGSPQTHIFPITTGALIGCQLNVCKMAHPDCTPAYGMFEVSLQKHHLKAIFSYYFVTNFASIRYGFSFIATQRKGNIIR